MDRRAFIAALAGSGFALVAPPVLASGPRHEIINIETRTEFVGVKDGRVMVSLSSNTDQASARLFALRDTMRPGDTVSIAVDGDIIGTITA